MMNAKFNTYNVKCMCEKKLQMTFRGKSHFVGYYKTAQGIGSRVVIPHGRKPIGPGLYKSIASNLWVDTDGLDGLLKCSVSRHDYPGIRDVAHSRTR